MRARLERAELPAGEIDAAVAELTDLGYLDDARYARVFAQDKSTLEDWGSDRIERVLIERGVDRGLIASALAEVSAEGEDDRALALLRRRFPEPSADPRERERALGVLIRKGYDSELAYDAVRAWSAGGSR
jgi:regulatory protein